MPKRWQGTCYAKRSQSGTAHRGSPGMRWRDGRDTRAVFNGHSISLLSETSRTALKHAAVSSQASPGTLRT